MAKKPVSRSTGEIRFALTRDEFCRLLHLVYIASWVLDAHKTSDDPCTAPYDELEQKLFTVAGRRGFDESATNLDEAPVEYASDFRKYFPTGLLEEGDAHVILDEYDDDTSWDELLHRLAERDAVREAGDFDCYAALSWEAKATLLDCYEVLYADELAENGLENIRIVHPRPPSRTVH